MRNKILSLLLSMTMILSLFAGFPITTMAETVGPTAVFNDGDLDRVYFSGDTLGFNLTGLSVGAPPTGIPVDTTIRICFGIIPMEGDFTSSNIFTEGTLVDATADGLGFYIERTLQADGTLSSLISGTVNSSLNNGVVAIRLFVFNGTSWQNIMQGQTPDFIPLTQDSKPAHVGLDSVMIMPAGVTSSPELGALAQNAEDLRNMNIAFSKSIATGIIGTISFTALNLMDNSAKLSTLDSGLVMLPVDTPTGGASEQYTMGVDVSADKLAFLADTGATVSVLSPSFDGLSAGDFSAAAADVADGIVSNLTFNDATDKVSFDVNHFSTYTLSMNNPNQGTPLIETVYGNAAAGLSGAKIYEAVTLANGNIGAIFNMSGSIKYGELNISENEWTTVTVGTTASTDVNAASLALDSAGRPHVVFVNTDNNLVYRYDTGSGWTSGVMIDSIAFGGVDGPLSSPDISIDASGYAHITYFDEKGGYAGGNSYPSYDKADLIYTTNASGSFVKTIREYSHGDTDYSSYYQQYQVISPSKIVLTDSGYYIGARYYDFNRTVMGNYKSYSHTYKLYRPLGSLPESYSNPLGDTATVAFNIFDMETNGSNAYSLFLKSGSLYITNGVSTISAATKAFGASAADMFVDNADTGKLYYAALSSNTLLFYQNGTFKESLTLPKALLSNHLKTSTVVISGTQYILYTDSSGVLRVLGYNTTEDADNPINTSSFPQITNANSSGFTIEASVDECATVYYIAVDKGATTPTSAQVISGASYSDPAVTIRASGSFPVLPNSVESATITGLVAATEYDVYVIARDNEGNLQTTPTLIQTVTGIPAGSGTITGVYDRNLNQDETDICITFSPAPDESKVSEYRVFVIPVDGASSFDLTAAESVTDPTRYITVAKTSISDGSYTVTLPAGAQVPASAPVTINTDYKIFVMSVAAGAATVNSLAGPSNTIAAKTYTGTLLLDDTTPAVGDPVTITLNDQDENHNQGEIDTVEVTVTSTLDATGISVTLTEFAANSGVFNGTFVVNSDGSNETTNLIHAVGGNTISAIYIDQVGADGSRNINVTTVAAVSATQLSMTALTVSGTAVSWNDVGSEQGYQLRVCYDNDTLAADVITLAANTTSYNITNVSPALAAGSYKVGVKAQGDGTILSDSAWSAFTSLIAIPSAALSTSDITPNRTGSSTINLTLTNVSDGNIINVYTSASGGTPFVSETLSGGNTTLSAVPVNSDVSTVYITKQDGIGFVESARTAVTLDTYMFSLSPAGIYTFPVLTDGYSSGTQHIQTFTITNTGSAPLAGISVAISGPDALSFEIIQPAGIIPVSESTIFTLKAKDSLAIDSGYIGNITVSAINALGLSFSVTQQVAAIPPLPAPANLTVNGTIVSWDTVSNSTGYIVTVKKNGSDVTGLTNITCAATSFDLSGRNLPGGTDYTVLVKANGNGTSYVDSPWSNLTDFSPSSVIVPALRLSTVTGFAISGTIVSWDVVSNAISYEVDILHNGVSLGGTLSAISTGLMNSIDLSGYGLAGGNYTVKVIAKGDGTSYSDSLQSIESGTISLPAPTLSNNINLSISGTIATWDAISNAVGYEIRVVKIVGPGLDIDLGSVTTSAITYDLITFAEHDNCVDDNYTVFIKVLGDGIRYATSSTVQDNVNLTPKTPKPSASNIIVNRTTDTKVKAIITGLVAGDIIKLYSTAIGGTELNTVTVSSGETSVTMDSITVSAISGSLYLTHTKVGRTESDRVEKNYAAYTQPSSGSVGDGASKATQGDTQITISTDGNTTTSSTEIPVTNNETTAKTTAIVSNQIGTLLLKSAKDTESTGGKAIVEIKVDTKVDTKAAEVGIPRDSFNKIADETNAELKVKTGIGTLVFDSKAVESISDASTLGDVVIGIAKVEKETLLESVREVVGERPVYDFSATVGGNNISNFGDGNATISIPYELQQGERPEAVVIYYIDDSGNLQTVEGKYNIKTGTVDFSVNHFSVYAVGYNEVVFKDVKVDSWFNQAVTFIAARDITTGIGNHMFGPSNTITRAEFIVMLMRAYGIKPSNQNEDNFSDAGDSYFTGYLAAAKQLGITTGMGDNRFIPNGKISRQDMFTLLYRTLNLLGEMPTDKTGKCLSDYGDFNKVSNYAKEAMQSLVATGTISGSAGKLDPDGKSTRAQMAQVLYNLLSK